jgi:hypothetical protein
MSMICELFALDADELQRVRSNPDEVIWSYFDGDAHPPRLDLDKSWHGLHFLLTATAWDGSYPLSFLCKGGEEIGEDFGYGPARLVAAPDTALLAATLNQQEPGNFVKAFSKASFKSAEIYPHVWSSDEPEDELRKWYEETYRDLRQFIADAASSGKAILVTIG